MIKIVTLITLFCISLYGFSQEFTGDWKGTLDVQGNTLEIIFHITGDKGDFTTTMDVPAQGAAGIPLESTMQESDGITISSSAIGVVKYDEGHGFYKEENQIELYKTMLGFLAENLK